MDELSSPCPVRDMARTRMGCASRRGAAVPVGWRCRGVERGPGAWVDIVLVPAGIVFCPKLRSEVSLIHSNCRRMKDQAPRGM